MVRAMQQEMQYIRIEFKCNHCDYRDCLELTLDEIVENSSADDAPFVGAGLQCETFLEHLEEVHDIRQKVVGLSTISSCLFGIDEQVTDPDRLILAMGGVKLTDHFTQV
jgi:uncharacterized Fe-S cluster-containing protein